MNSTVVNRTTYIHHKKKSDRVKTKNLNWQIKSRLHLNYYSHYLHLPFLWNLVILRKLKTPSMYLYSNTYFVNLSLPVIFQNYHFDINTNIMSFTNVYDNNYSNIYFHYLRRLISLCNSPHFIKIKFKGKGYYIYKNRRSTITPQFGFAHRHYIYASQVSVNFRTKTSILLYGMSMVDLLLVGGQIKALRPINIFTGRGVRFNKQIIYKKTGKVSSYR